MAINKQLPRRAFEQAAKRTTLQPRGIEIARCVMVDKELQAVVAKRFDVGPPQVSRYVSTVWSAHVDSESLPPGWQQITAILPEEKVAIVRTWESEGRMTRFRESIDK